MIFNAPSPWYFWQFPRNSSLRTLPMIPITPQLRRNDYLGYTPYPDPQRGSPMLTLTSHGIYSRPSIPLYRVIPFRHFIQPHLNTTSSPFYITVDSSLIVTVVIFLFHDHGSSSPFPHYLLAAILQYHLYPKNTVNTFSSQPSCAHNKRFIYALPTWPFTVTVFIQQSRTTNTRWSEERLSCIRYPRKFQVGTGFPLFQVLPDYSPHSSLYPSKDYHYNFTNNTFILLSFF